MATGFGVIMSRRLLLFFTIAAGNLCFAAASAFGQNWTPTTAPTNAWVAVAASADCSTIAAVIGGGGIYNSLDAGTNWNLSNASSNNWTAIACSTNGVKMAAAVNGGGIWLSSDSGTSWSPRTATNHSWLAVASSSDGARLIAGGAGGIWISTNTGGTWEMTRAPSTNSFGELSYYAVVSSADGTTLVGLSGGPEAGLWLSTNAGSTWTDEGSSAWVSIAGSADGSKLAATIGNAAWV